MDIKQILSHRSDKHQNYALPIIYEWEDILAEKLNLSIINKTFIQKLINRLKLKSIFCSPQKNTFRFVFNGRQSDEPMNNKHIIPCIIDFFEQKKQLEEFYAKHSNNKIVLLSSPFDYEYLKKNKCPLNIGLFAYSLSDKYAIENTAVPFRNHRS